MEAGGVGEGNGVAAGGRGEGEATGVAVGDAGSGRGGLVGGGLRGAAVGDRGEGEGACARPGASRSQAESTTADTTAMTTNRAAVRPHSMADHRPCAPGRKASD